MFPRMSSEGYHEPLELLSESTKDLHRAITSLIEELEAVDWYTQRAEACTDPALRDVITHHRNEEVEHAMMNLEWIRRHDAFFEDHMRTYLFTSAPITAVEVEKTKSEVGANGGANAGGGAGGSGAPGGALGIGSLRPGEV
jgi:ferritin-like protein